MSSKSDFTTSTDSNNQSKLDVIESVLDVLELQLGVLDNAGFSMASIHLNDAIERLRGEKVRLDKSL